MFSPFQQGLDAPSGFKRGLVPFWQGWAVPSWQVKGRWGWLCLIRGAPSRPSGGSAERIAPIWGAGSLKAPAGGGPGAPRPQHRQTRERGRGHEDG